MFPGAAIAWWLFRAVVSLVQQGLALLPLVLSVMLDKYLCPSIAQCRGPNEDPGEHPALLGSGC